VGLATGRLGRSTPWLGLAASGLGLAAAGLGIAAAGLGWSATGVGDATGLGIPATRMEPGVHAVAGGIRALPVDGGG
jgi:hypothetical protein